MNIRFSKSIRAAILLVGLFLLSACGTFELGMEPELVAATPEASLTVTTQPTPSPAQDLEVTPVGAIDETPPVTELAEPSPETPVQETWAPSPLWATYRDPNAGYGYAFPCHWVSQGTTLPSYDEAYFLDRSIRGHWAEGAPPDGAVKLEIAAFDYAESGIEPGTSLEEAVPLAISDNIVASERVHLGQREALRVELEGTVYPGDATNEIYFFEVSPTRMLMFSVLPRSALTSPDVQGIIESLALSEAEPIVIPANDPQGPLEGREILADTAAGYCFQYPSEYTLEAFPPSGIPYAGDISTLKLERPFYTVGLTSSVLPVGEQSTLEELVSQFIQGLPEGAASQVERNPAERIGGVDFQIGWEPAEFLEGVPGADGSREILAKHADRLYRLSFVPSIRVNPQAAPELESLFLTVTTSFSFLPLD